MKKETSDQVWLRLLGEIPDVKTKQRILEKAEEEKISLAEACAKYGYVLPPIYIGDEPAGPYDNPYLPPIRIVARKKQ